MKPSPQNYFKERLRESILNGTAGFPSVRVAKGERVYLSGDPADSVYFIQSGQVKLLMLSPEGKECLLAIHTAGDVFGELCLGKSECRQESAIAMKEAVLRRLPRSQFFQHLTGNSLFEYFVHYLANRLGEQQQVIANLMTVDSEHRLGETLLLLARKLGRRDQRQTLIEQRITHEELSEMVGTTRPRITQFLRAFRRRGLIEISARRFIIKEEKLSNYLAWDL